MTNIILESLRFLMSTLQYEGIVFKRMRFLERFENAVFSMSENTVSVRSGDQNREKTN